MKWSGAAGEGTGLKSMKEVDWREGEEVTVKVSGQREGEHWVCSCHYILRGEENFMATFRRTGPPPLNRRGFYSFVEDWDRCSGAVGHLTCRQAHFLDQRITIEEQQLDISLQTSKNYQLGVTIEMKCQIYDCRAQR